MNIAGLVSLPQTMACYMQLAQQLKDHQQAPEQGVMKTATAAL
jgi:hypothetical protein